MSTPVAGERVKKPTIRERLVLERRDELIDAAMLAFSRHGYHATSLKEIAEIAGVTDGLVIHYFGSKQALLSAVLVERSPLLATIDAIVAGAPEDDPEAALRHVATQWLATLQGTARPLMGVLIAEARHNVEVGDALAAHANAAFAPILRLLRQLAENGRIHGDHLPVAARMIHWSLVWYAFGRDVSPAYGMPEPAEWVDGLVAILLGGLMSPPPNLTWLGQHRLGENQSSSATD